MVHYTLPPEQVLARAGGCVKGSRPVERKMGRCAWTVVAVAWAGLTGPVTSWGQSLAAPGAKECEVHFDFETGKLRGWRVVEGKFDFLVCNKKMFRNRPREKYNKQGQYFLSTIELTNGRGDDRMTGVVESPVFVLMGPEMNFLVGGGNRKDTYLALCTLDGKEVIQARGRNTETLFRVTWHQPKLVGKKVFLRVYDNHVGGWGHVIFDDFTATGRIDPEATKQHFARRKRVLAKAKGGVRPPRGRAVRKLPSPGSPETLRAAVADLAATFGERYPRAKEYLARLDEIERRLKGADGEAKDKVFSEFLALQREALLANPLVSGQPILFVVREQYRGDHHNTATMFQTGEINTGSFRGKAALKAVSVGAGGKVRTLLAMPTGVIRDPEVSFDGRKVLFSMRRDIKDDYHVYEMLVASGHLTQLTFGGGVCDFDPLYLPDGRIAFSSTREPKYCMCNRHIMGNLFRMDADGANLHQIGKSTLHEGHGAIMPDGRILYDRWEYVDRNFGDAQGVWTCNPDGTNHAVWYGNNTPSPGAILDSRVLPNTGGDRFIATYSSCHDRPWGALAVVDRSRGIDTPRNGSARTAPEVRMWPAGAWGFLGRGNYDMFMRTYPKYEDPHPLSDKTFLCSRMIGQGEKMGIYLLDVFGNEILLHHEDPGCFDPMPLRARRRPPIIPDRTALASSEGSFYVYDVYVGTGMEKVARGAVKSLRVVESPEKRFWTNADWQGSGTQAPGMAWDDFNNKRILGTVPVEPDGSAYFRIPADRFVYFQLLDANGMMIQSMRSGTIVRPGETTGCVGCHESRHSTAANHAMAALRRPARKLKDFYGPPRLYNYVAEAQCVFDKHCVKCHDYASPTSSEKARKAAGKVVLAGDLGMIFNASYHQIRSKGLLRVPGAGPTQTLMPYSWGSHASKLVQVIRKGHNQVKLDKESFDRLVTWIDINAPYYPSYASAYPHNRYGRSPLSPKQVGRLSKLVGVNLNDQGRAVQVSFDRPEKSPCLARLKDKSGPEYAEALAIIRAGKALLAERPRAEMPGFRLLGTEARREAKYQACAETLAKMREAIVSGAKKYHPGAPGGGVSKAPLEKPKSN